MDSTANPMPSGERSVCDGAAVCEIRENASLPAHLRSATREVNNLRTLGPLRGLGHATALMQQVCAEADQASVILMLFVGAADDAPLDDAKLEQWYGERFGFMSTQQHPVMMVRMPGATPRVLDAPALQPLTLSFAARAMMQEMPAEPPRLTPVAAWLRAQ